MSSTMAKELLTSQSVNANLNGVSIFTLGGDINFIGLIKVTNATLAVKEITSIITRADVASNLDATYFILQDDVGSVAFWIDVGNTGTTIPSGANAADRAIEITTVTADMTKAQVGSVVYTAVIGDSKFEAGSDDAAGNLLIQASTTGQKTDGIDGDTNFTIVEDTEGTAVCSFAAEIQHSHNELDWFTLLDFSAVIADVVEMIHVDNTTVHVAGFVRVKLTRTSGRATFEVDLLHDRRRL